MVARSDGLQLGWCDTIFLFRQFVFHDHPNMRLNRGKSTNREDSEEPDEDSAISFLFLQQTTDNFGLGNSMEETDHVYS